MPKSRQRRDPWFQEERRIQEIRKGCELAVIILNTKATPTRHHLIISSPTRTPIALALIIIHFNLGVFIKERSSLLVFLEPYEVEKSNGGGVREPVLVETITQRFVATVENSKHLCRIRVKKHLNTKVEGAGCQARSGLN